MESELRCLLFTPGAEPRILADMSAISDLLRDPQAIIWLDVIRPTPHDFVLLQEEFSLHPLAIEDAVKANQRPKIEAYGDVWFTIVNAASYRAGELFADEIAMFTSRKFFITIRAEQRFSQHEICERLALLPLRRNFDVSMLFFATLDAIVDAYLPIADVLEEQVDLLDAALLGEEKKTDQVLRQAFVLKRDLNRFRRTAAPIQTILQPILRGGLSFIDAEMLPYYRDVEDHVSRALVQIDDARDQINNARETHIAIVSHRQSEISKQLTLIATIFLPLTFVTGFFGQNFGYMVNGIATKQSFFLLGIGIDVLVTLGFVGYFRYRNWR